MRKENKSNNTDAELDWLFPLITKLVNNLGNLKNFEFDADDKAYIVQSLHQWHQAELDAYHTANDPLDKQTHAINLVQISTDYVEELDRYRKSRKEQKDREFVNQCHINNIPLDLATKNNISSSHLQPSDCSALHGWPDKRLPANGISGRLENAGQFIERLFNEKVYDENVYGPLYMSDLKHINPRLYQSLAQWQSRTGNRLLKTKREEIDKLIEEADSGTDLTFHQAAKVRNARWRRKRLNQQNSQ